MRLLKIWNNDNRPFYVRLLKNGENYGLDDCLTHDGPDIIEFYDATSAGKTRPRGQFVSRYFVTTLDHYNSTHGLDLQGNVDEWKISARNVCEALIFARAFK